MPEETPTRSPPCVEAVVLGLRSGSGASTLARGLAAVLASAAGRHAHLLALGSPRNGVTPRRGGLLGGGSLLDVPAGLHDSDKVAEYGSMVVRAGVEGAALVWDVPPREIERAGAAAARADVVIAVAHGSGEPALAEVVSGMLAERFAPVVLVANNVSDRTRWAGRAEVCVPGSRWGALVAGHGRRPGGAFGAALAQLAALAEREAALTGTPRQREVVSLGTS